MTVHNHICIIYIHDIPVSMSVQTHTHTHSGKFKSQTYLFTYYILSTYSSQTLIINNNV